MSSFKRAFAAARKSGAKTFDWNGKSYTTELASDAPKPRANPERVAKPRPKPSMDAPAMPKSRGATSMADAKMGERSVPVGKPTYKGRPLRDARIPAEMPVARPRPKPDTMASATPRAKPKINYRTGGQFKKGGMVKKKGC